ncbi:hypothetical protein MROS_2154 [Melioribacter roseus P3M-2]|uniref:Uncharacterized protein n=1 Tax=Melioribacter roseus (strain DSM 23840 / JCM 17771 / VKM B-2668 / P3M-2) TaxID=1191523 RepID=I6ZTM4_MELRP|nr:hypothetical protein [Melioribacter roseus]AFN75384.1 hypothetical protein MROS_2154 [Melioribacter roseus P3M-2]
MRTLIAILILLYGLPVRAQSDSLSLQTENEITAEDSVNVRELVAQQILMAKIKNEKKEIKEPDIIQTAPEYENESPVVIKKKKSVYQLFVDLPFNVKLLISFSAFLFALIFIRRAVLKAQQKARKKLKIKIGMMREEKLQPTTDIRRSKFRKELLSNPVINKLNDKNINKKAKELKVAQGELMLAARLKYYEFHN